MGGLVEQLPLVPGQVQCLVQVGVDLEPAGVMAEAEVAPPELTDGDVRLGNGVVQQPGLLGDGLLEHGVAPL